MSNDEEIKEVLLKILTEGLVRIRAHGFAGEAEACAREADHLHNLPQLVQSMRPELLLYYYNTERRCYLQCALADAEAFQPLWDKLGRLVDDGSAPAGAT